MRKSTHIFLLFKNRYNIILQLPSYKYKVISMLNIIKTSNYNQFKTFTGNRPIKEQALVNSIKEKNLLHLKPIMVTKDFFVVDGQHRLAAAKILDVPIYYVTCENLTENDIPVLNFNQSSWNLSDFLHFYVNEGYSEYIFVHNIMKEYKLPLHFVVRSSAATDSAQCFSWFSSGKFKTKNKHSLRDDFAKFNEAYILCNKICGLRLGICSKSMRCLWSLMNKNNYSHKNFLHKCKLHPDLIIKAFSFREYKNITDHLQSLYNRNLGADKKI